MYSLLKKALDLFASMVLIILLSPFMLLTAIAIKIDSPGPVFADIPMRVGKNGKLFKLYKFRSMIPNAQELLMKDPGMKKLFEEYKKNNYKLRNDPRITRVGSFIRSHSIDEFPQLFNILGGNMSLVGPRPYYQFEIKEYINKYPHLKKEIEAMHTVLPGITGEWQVSGRSEIDFEKRIKMDADYARRKNILDDFKILFRTPWAVISGKGAY